MYERPWPLVPCDWRGRAVKEHAICPVAWAHPCCSHCVGTTLLGSGTRPEPLRLGTRMLPRLPDGERHVAARGAPLQRHAHLLGDVDVGEQQLAVGVDEQRGVEVRRGRARTADHALRAGVASDRARRLDERRGVRDARRERGREQRERHEAKREPETERRRSMFSTGRSGLAGARGRGGLVGQHQPQVGTRGQVRVDVLARRPGDHSRHARAAERLAEERRTWSTRGAWTRSPAWSAARSPCRTARRAARSPARRTRRGPRTAASPPRRAYPGWWRRPSTRAAPSRARPTRAPRAGRRSRGSRRRRDRSRPRGTWCR